MAIYRLQESDYPSTEQYHLNRERAPHLEQNWHRGRLVMAVKFIRRVHPKTVVDLGCGDGGLLSLLKGTGIEAWGYDFCPANGEGWDERGVTAELADVFNTDFEPRWGELAVMTEVLEHLADPHGAVEWVARNSKFIVASSPFDENPEKFGDKHGHPEGDDMNEHIWGFDKDGFLELIGAHFNIEEWRRVDWTQIVLGRSHYV